MKKRTRRQLRTLLIAIFAAATFAWSAIYIFDVPSKTMLQLFLLSGMVIVLMMLAAIIPSLLLYYFRHVRKQEEDKKADDTEQPGAGEHVADPEISGKDVSG